VVVETNPEPSSNGGRRGHADGRPNSRTSGNLSVNAGNNGVGNNGSRASSVVTLEV